jgi:monoterpene epsilon-lactone hydrolase
MVILYLHGGGYVMGSLHSHGPLTAHLAHLTSTPVYGLDFRRAPEHPYPAALDDTRAAYDALLGKGWAPEQIVLAGDSAGGGLVLALMSRLRDEGAVPAGGILLSPWLDLALTGASMERLAGVDPWTTRAALELFAGMYAGEASVDHPEISPVNMDFRGLPPLLVHVSASEILLDDARTTQDRASAAGVDVEFRSWEGVPHVFQLFAGFLPEADESLRDISDWFEKRRTS